MPESFFLLAVVWFQFLLPLLLISGFQGVQKQYVNIRLPHKKPIPKLEEASDSDRDLLGHLLLTVKKVAAEAKLSQGYRVVINNGEEQLVIVQELERRSGELDTAKLIAESLKGGIFIDAHHG